MSAPADPAIVVENIDVPGAAEILTPDALAFVADLQRRFSHERISLLEARHERQKELDAGVLPDFLAGTADVRSADWRVAPAPADLDDRRVEITGPAEPKMMINALNSGARVFMADLEDALSPTWANVVGGQAALRAAVRRELTFDSPEGKAYRLNEDTATLLVRPRGWHLVERHVIVDGGPISASLFDFGLYFFHNAAELVARGTGPYFYLAKLESHHEARLWNEVFVHAQTALGIPRGTIRATVLIETILAAFEMDEILNELREHAAGLNAGRWDYLFSCIKKFRGPSAQVLPGSGPADDDPAVHAGLHEPARRDVPSPRGARDRRHGGVHPEPPRRRGQCHGDGQGPRRQGARVRRRVRRDVGRPSGPRAARDGDLRRRPGRSAQPEGPAPRRRRRQSARSCGTLGVDGGTISEAGYRANVSVALQYLDAWLSGNGAAAINNLMEDAATAEISRSQLWQWRTSGARLDDGREASADLYRAVRDEELAALGGPSGGAGRLSDAAALLDRLVLDDEFAEFLTLRAYSLLD